MNHATKPTNVRWAVFAVACGASWLLYLHRYAFALMKPYLAKEWGLDKTALGQLDSVFDAAYALAQVPVGMVADVMGVRLVLTAMIVVWSTGLGLHAWAGSMAQMTVARVVLGIGQSATYAALTRMSRQWYPASIRTTLQGLANVLAGRLGGLSANLIFASLLIGVFHVDWRVATSIFAALGIVQAMVTYLIVRDSPREHPRVNAAELELLTSSPVATPAPTSPPTTPSQHRMTFAQTLRGLDRRGLVNLLALNLQTLLSTLADSLYSRWIPLFLWETYRLESAQMGVFASLPLLGGAAGGVLGGLLNDQCLRITGNRRWSRSGVAIAGKSIAAALLFAAFIWYDRPYVFCTVLFFVKFFGDWSLTTSIGVTSDIGGRATASVFAFNNALAAGGLMIASVWFGWVAQHWGWPSVFVIVAVMYALCAVSWLAIDCTVPLVRDTNGAARRR